MERGRESPSRMPAQQGRNGFEDRCSRSLASTGVHPCRQIHLCCPSPSTGVRQRFPWMSYECCTTDSDPTKSIPQEKLASFAVAIAAPQTLTPFPLSFTSPTERRSRHRPKVVDWRRSSFPRVSQRGSLTVDRDSDGAQVRPRSFGCRVPYSSGNGADPRHTPRGLPRAGGARAR
jgi:hypothetical protein